MKKIIIVSFVFLLFGSASLIFTDGAMAISDGTSTQSTSDGSSRPKTQTLYNPLCPPDEPDCNRSTIPGLLESLIKWLTRLAAPVAVGMILYGAYQMLLSGGNPEKFQAGRRTIFYAVIGYGIILIGYGIVNIIKEVLSE